MNKYSQLLSISWQNGMVYRASIYIWRLRHLLSSFFALTIWSVLFRNTQSAFGYSESEMMAYIFLTSIIQSLVLSTSLNGLTNAIYSGEISILLTKPIGLFKALATQEIADKSKNFGFVLVESLILFAIFLPTFPPIQLTTAIVGFIWICGGLLLNFTILLLFGAIGFWSPDSWGPRFLFIMLSSLLGGKMFPLDVLPQFVQNVVWLTPFPFLSYAQAQLLLSKLTSIEIIIGFVGLVFWIGMLSVLVRIIWSVGLKEYVAAGQ